MPFACDTCGRIYSNKRNLCRHIKEKHDDGLLHFKCCSPGCKAKFIRRSYLSKHLNLIHKMDKKEAKQLVSQVLLEPEHHEKRTPLYETCHYEDISDDQIVQKNQNSPAVGSSSEFDNWLDEIVQSSPGKRDDYHSKNESKLDLADETGYNDDEEPTLEEFYSKAENELNTPNDAHDSNNDQPSVEIFDESPDSNGEEDAITEQVEYINITLKTTTSFRNGTIDNIDRVVSLAYSDNFNPQNSENVDPMTVFRRVQEEYVNFVNEYSQ